MTTTVSKITPASAPRDPQGLMKLGIFALRLLIVEAGGLQSNEEKLAFAKMNVDEKVVLAQQLLARWDQAHGGQMPMNGAGHAAPAPMQMMPAPQGMPVMQVDPAAVAAAAAAVAPPAPAPTTRKPRNAAAQAQTEAPTDLGSDVVNLLNRIVAQNDESNTALAAGFKDILNQLAETNKTGAENATNYKAVYGALGVMNQQLQAIQFQAKLSMALSLQLAEQVLGGATREQVLGAAMGDVETIGQILQQATNPGKG